MYLLQVHPSIEEAQEVPVPFIHEEIAQIVAARRAKVASGEVKVIEASAKKRSRDTPGVAENEAAAARKAALRALYSRLLGDIDA
jgi:hypothetical protein